MDPGLRWRGEVLTVLDQVGRPVLVRRAERMQGGLREVAGGDVAVVGVLAIPRAMTSSNAVGMAGFRRLGRGIGSIMCAAIRLLRLSAWKGLAP